MENVDVAGAEDDGVEDLGDEGDTCDRLESILALRGKLLPSALRLRWMAKMRMHFDNRWRQSPVILKNCLAVSP